MIEICKIFCKSYGETPDFLLLEGSWDDGSLD